MKKYDVNLRKIKNKKLRVVISLFVGVLFAGYCAYAYIKTGTIAPSAELIDGRPTVRFIDVGQGDSALVTYKGESVLVDAGPADAGKSVAEYVRTYSPSVDYFIISHPHEDHMGGASDILRTVRVENLVINAYTSDDNFYIETLETAEERGTNIIVADEPMTLHTDNIMINILDNFGYIYDDINDTSLIVRVDVDDTSVLFPGDAEKNAESNVMSTSYNMLDVDILKVGHHGSKTSTSEEFLKAVSPDIAVISCMKNNSYGHPSQNVVNLLKKYCIEIYRTDRMGTVVIH